MLETRTQLKINKTNETILESFLDKVHSGPLQEKQRLSPAGLQRRQLALRTGVGIIIPREYFQGTQRIFDYFSKKTHRLDQILEKMGIEYFILQPVIACVLPHKLGVDVVVEDGHSALRRAGKFGINKIPSILLTTEELASLRNAYPEKRSLIPYTPESITRELTCAMVETKDSFIKSGHAYKQNGYSVDFGRSIRGVRSITELRTMFSAF